MYRNYFWSVLLSYSEVIFHKYLEMVQAFVHISNIFNTVSLLKFLYVNWDIQEVEEIWHLYNIKNNKFRCDVKSGKVTYVRLKWSKLH